MKKWLAAAVVFLMLDACSLAEWEVKWYEYDYNARWVNVMAWNSYMSTWVFQQNEWLVGSGGALSVTALEYNRWYWIGVWDYTTSRWIRGSWVASL